VDDIEAEERRSRDILANAGVLRRSGENRWEVRKSGAQFS
jgi:hypothetical protein